MLISRHDAIDEREMICRYADAAAMPIVLATYMNAVLPDAMFAASTPRLLIVFADAIFATAFYHDDISICLIIACCRPLMPSDAFQIFMLTFFRYCRLLPEMLRCLYISRRLLGPPRFFMLFARLLQLLMLIIFAVISDDILCINIIAILLMLFHIRHCFRLRLSILR